MDKSQNNRLQEAVPIMASPKTRVCREMDWEERGKLVKALQDGVENDKIQDSGFFNRKWELKALLASLATEADNVTVVVGPNNCGKTLLLKRLKAVWRSEKELAATSPVFYFDFRKQVWRTPGEAASHLARKFKSWKDVFLQWADAVKSGVSGVTIKPTLNRSIIAEIALKAITDVLPLGGSSGSDLARVMDAFSAVLHKSKLVHPIFILDEANMLADWNRQDVAALAGFFKSLVKQDRKAYLILSSSDSPFKSWLRQMFNADEWRAFGVGFFPETDARRFFTGISIPRAFGTMPQPFQDSDWQAIYAVCGGSPLLLNQCAKTALVCELSWQEAVETLTRNALLVVESGMNAKDMDFNGENYRSISKVIVQQGFMGVNAALKDIYKGDAKQCKAEILAMLAGGLIHLRYMTPATRYGDINWTDAGKEHEIITARSPAERAAMKEFLGLC